MIRWLRLADFSRSRQASDSDRTGVVLFVVFVVVALAALAGYTFVVAVQGDNKAAQIGADQLQAEHLARSGEAFVASWISLPREERVAIEEDQGTDIFAQQVTHQTKGDASQPSIGSFYIVQPMSICELMQGTSSPTAVTSTRTRTSGSSSSSNQSGNSKWQMGVVNESSKLHLGTLLVWDATWPGSGRNALLNLPGMTDEIADAILDWVDADDQPRDSGAEAGEYGEQPRPYRPRNAIPDSLDELLLVRGVTPMLLFGDPSSTTSGTTSSTSQNASSSSSPSSRSSSTPAGGSTNRNSPGAGLSSSRSAAGSSGGRSGRSSGGRSTGRDEPVRPWSHYLTVVSSERDETYAGDRRIFVNDDDLGKIAKTLKEEKFEEDVAKFILLYRQYGPYVNQPEAPAGEENIEVNLTNGDVDTDSLFNQTNPSDGKTGTNSVSKPKRPNRPPPNTVRVTNQDSELDEPDGDYIPIEEVELPQAPEAGAAIARSAYELVNAIVPLPPEESPDNGDGNRPSQPDQPGKPNRGDGGNNGNGEEAPTARFVRSPITTDTLSNADIAEALDKLSIVNAQGGISGRINLFEAPAAVVAGLPNLEAGQAAQIVAARATVKRDEARQSLAWLAKANVLSPIQFRELAPFLTVGGEVVTFEAIGSHGERRLHYRYAVTIDASDKLVRRAAFRDLRRSGRANLFDDLPKAVKPPTSRRSGSSRSNSRSKSGPK